MKKIPTSLFDDLVFAGFSEETASAVVSIVKRRESEKPVKAASIRQARWRLQKRLQASTETSTAASTKPSTASTKASTSSRPRGIVYNNNNNLVTIPTLEEKTGTKKSVDASVDVSVDMAVERWRQFAEKYGRPHVRVVSPKLAANIHARFEQMRSLWPDITDDERICRLLKAVSGSEFLLGHTDRWGGATLD